MGDRRCVRVLVTGLVQGVWYRGSTRERATELGLTGWVRNLADGRVEAIFAGPGTVVAEMLAWCEQGPPSARVERVDVEDIASEDVDSEDGRAGFVVRYR